jgi:hypothetical protein
MQFQEKMIKSGKFRSSAVGKYQYTQETLAGTAKMAGIDTKTTKFTPEIQERIMDVSIASYKEDIKALNQPFNLQNFYLRHFGGKAGYKKIIEAPETANVGEVLGKKAAEANPELSKMTIAELKKRFAGVAQQTAARNTTAPPQQRTTEVPPVSSVGQKVEKESRPIVARDNSVQTVLVVNKIIERHIPTGSFGSAWKSATMSDNLYDPKPQIVTR